jgi:group I intron endonuclease
MMGCIYQAKNLINGKIYVGKTVRTLAARKRGHKCAMRKGSVYCFHNALRKYGLENFQWEVLYQSDDETKLLEMEVEFIKLLSATRPIGYNLTEGGKGPTGFTHTPEFKAKMKSRMIGNTNGVGKTHTYTEAERENHRAAMLGKKHSPETKAKLSAAQKGRKWSSEAKAKASARMMGNNISAGRKRSEETKAKMSDAHTHRNAAIRLGKFFIVERMGNENVG